jgi:tripeptide aminopeptidase
VERPRLHETFVRLCEIRSPTGEEREVTDTIAAELRALGLEVSEDDAARPAEAGAGNLLARLPGQIDEWVMFCAHVDTVPHEGQIEVVQSDGIFRSAGETILGADNKAAVAVFIELVARYAAEPPPVGIELVLTVAEEQGLRGAKAFDASVLRSERGFVLDHASAIGEVIVTSPDPAADPRRLPRGRGPRRDPPEDGSNAIAAAAAAIAAWSWAGSTRDDRQRRRDPGGTSGNVVPGHCRIVAEARSLDADARGRGRRRDRRAPAPGARASTAATSTCGSRSSSAATSRRRSRPLALAEAGLRGRGFEPSGPRRRRQRRQRPDRRRIRLRAARQWDRGQSHAARVGLRTQPRCDAGGLRGHRRRGSRGPGVSGRLKLRRGVVVGEAPLMVEIDGEQRPAWADTGLLGEMREGDEVVVNVEALDLALGSGGFDVVHVNLTRGLKGDGPSGEQVMKLNYTSLQHAVEPVELPVRSMSDMESQSAPEAAKAAIPVLVLPLHGHLAPAAWAAAQARRARRSATCRRRAAPCRVAEPRRRRAARARPALRHITAAPAYGGEHEAISVAGALDAAAGASAGTPSSSARPGHHRLRDPASATAAWRPSTRPRRARARLPTCSRPASPRPTPRAPPRVSHHTLTVLEMLLGAVEVPLPAGIRSRSRQLSERCGERHQLARAPPTSRLRRLGLPARTMGRGIDEDHSSSPRRSPRAARRPCAARVERRRREPAAMASRQPPPAESRRPASRPVLDFLSYLELERGLSRNTLNAYRTDLLQYGEFLAAHELDALEVRPGRRRDFLADLATGNGRPACSARRPPQGRLPALLLQAPAP